MQNNPITLPILQAAIDTAYHLGIAKAQGQLDAALAENNANMHGSNVQKTAVLLHWVHCREIEIATALGDPEHIDSSRDTAAQYIHVWALAGAWNAVYRREQVIADYLCARIEHFMGNGDTEGQNPLAPYTPFDSILPPELRAMLDIIAYDATENP